MENIQYVGEHLIPGQVGHALVILAFIASLVAVLSGFLYEKTESKPWKRLMRGSFLVHYASIIGIISTIIFMMVNYYYEYKYVQAHVNDILPMEYILSAFWEGQEGSFLLWMFWNSTLGCVIMSRKGKWENLVIPIIGIAQAILLTMIMGIYLPIGETATKIGSSPFVLLRNTMDAPIFSNPHYLELIQGQGLNVLLQNYWNVIHPPILFLGFSSVIVPFAYAMSSLIRGEYLSWLRPARNWALFSSFVLGLGICLGGMWAYEALTFGGYWAWDPVENMSLVPWLLMVAGLHSNAIVLSTRQSLKSTYIFYILAFVGITYSTFLTRSGALQQTSVHAFTQEGLGPQLLALIAIFGLFSLILYFYRRKKLPVPAREEPIQSKEFWMYMGSLVIVISACLITYGTSLPVINNLIQYFDPQFKPMVIEDQVAHYNKHQLWIGVLMGLLTAVSQFFRFRGGGWKSMKNQVFMQIGLTALLAGLLAFGSSYIIDAYAWQYKLLLFSAWFAIIGNVLAFIMQPVRNYNLLGSTTSHLGFGILLLGILYTGLNQRVISSNMFAQQGLANVSDNILKKNLILLKGEPMLMQNYKVTYEADSMEHQYRHYFLEVKELSEDLETVEDSFMLVPNVIYNKEFNDVEALNPAIRRGVFADMFTRITRLPLTMMNPQKAAEMDDTLNYVDYAGYVGDTIFTRNYAVTIKNYHVGSDHGQYKAQENDHVLSADFYIYDIEVDTTYIVSPTLLLRGPMVYSLPIKNEDLNIRIRLRDTIFTDLLIEDSKLDYKTVALTRGESVKYGPYTIHFQGVDSDVSHPSYTPQEGDLAIAAILQVSDEQGNSYELDPLYVIRDKRANGIRDLNLETGLYARVNKVDPKSEKIYFDIAQGKKLGDSKVYFELVEDVPETDFIVFQATIIPGINLVWLGMILTLSGFMITLIIRSRQKRMVKRKS